MSYTKQELANLYGISRSTLKTLFNKTYLKELEAVGYQKSQQIVSPKVLKTFYELYGEPFTDEKNES